MSAVITTERDVLPVETVRGKVTMVALPTPPIGGKCWVLDRKGTFVLETGPGVLRTCACTHFGTGSLYIYDGLPDHNGEFPDEGMQVHDARFSEKNGRELFRADPSLMGSWMLDAGFTHGLTVKHRGGHISTSTIASIVWLPYRTR